MISITHYIIFYLGENVMVAANEQLIGVSTWLDYPKEPKFNLTANLSRHDGCYNHQKKKKKKTLTHNCTISIEVVRWKCGRKHGVSSHAITNEKIAK